MKALDYNCSWTHNIMGHSHCISYKSQSWDLWSTHCSNGRLWLLKIARVWWRKALLSLVKNILVWFYIGGVFLGLSSTVKFQCVSNHFFFTQWYIPILIFKFYIIYFKVIFLIITRQTCAKEMRVILKKKKEMRVRHWYFWLSFVVGR